MSPPAAMPADIKPWQIGQQIADQFADPDN